MNTRVPGNRYPLHLTISAPFITLMAILDMAGLFLNSGAWLEYGRRSLRFEQLNAVDMAQYLG